MDVKIAFLAGLIDPVATLGAGFGRRLAEGCGCQKVITLPFQNLAVLAQFSSVHKVNPAV
jgi:hypothetical protein